MSKKVIVPLSANAQALAAEIKVTSGFKCNDGFYTYTALNPVPGKPGYWFVSGNNSSGGRRRHHSMSDMSEQELVAIRVQELTGLASEPKPAKKKSLWRILRRRTPEDKKTMIRDAILRQQQRDVEETALAMAN